MGQSMPPKGQDRGFVLKKWNTGQLAHPKPDPEVRPSGQLHSPLYSILVRDAAEYISCEENLPHSTAAMYYQPGLMLPAARSRRER
jgi:hypothetical protein